jgi:hypothetical protein
MGLVNDLNYQLEREKIKEEFCLFSEDRMVYCITSLDGTKLYKVQNCYNIAKSVQQTYRINTCIWFVQSKKAQEHFIKHLLIKNTKKLHKENKKLMDIESIEKIASSHKADTVLFSTTISAIAIQRGKIRFQRMISNGEKNCKFYPFNGTATQAVKEYYFNRYLQCYGS